MNEDHGIIGARVLNQGEIDLMNRIKAHAEGTRALVNDIGVHVNAGLEAARNANTPEPLAMMFVAAPLQWLSLAREGFQVAFMKLTRAVAQPTSF